MTRQNPLPDFPANLIEFQRMFADAAAADRITDAVLSALEKECGI
jgi:hypothetical protein